MPSSGLCYSFFRFWLYKKLVHSITLLMNDSVSSLFPEKGRGLAIFGSLIWEEKGIGAVWSWTNANEDGCGKSSCWCEGERGKWQGEGWGEGWGIFCAACIKAIFCVKLLTCCMRFPMFIINTWITVMVSANWVSRFDDMELIPDSWDISEKMGVVEHSCVKDKAVMKE